jgi:hypothetical protein
VSFLCCCSRITIPPTIEHALFWGCKYPTILDALRMSLIHDPALRATAYVLQVGRIDFRVCFGVCFESFLFFVVTVVDIWTAKQLQRIDERLFFLFFCACQKQHAQNCDNRKGASSTTTTTTTTPKIKNKSFWQRLRGDIKKDEAGQIISTKRYNVHLG